MPKPTPAPMPSLVEFDPAAVALEATRAAVERASRLALPLSPSVRLDLSDTSDAALTATDLAATFRALTVYAQKGLPVWDWTSDEDAADALLGATEVMFAAPGRDWTPAQLDEVLSPSRGEELSAPVLVLACAWTRVRIARGDAVPVVALARLASISDERVHQFAREGRLAGVTTAREGRALVASVTAEGAREWLVSRGLWPGARVPQGGRE